MEGYTVVILNLLKNKEFLYAVLITCCVAMIALVAYYFWHDRKQNGFSQDANLGLDFDTDNLSELEATLNLPDEMPLCSEQIEAVDLTDSYTAVRLMDVKQPGHFVQVELPLEGVASIGRDKRKNNVNFSTTASVSAIHCQIFNDNNEVKVRDMRSSNGTYVNGKKITEDTVLREGDQFQIGELKFLINLVKSSER